MKNKLKNSIQEIFNLGIIILIGLLLLITAFSPVIIAANTGNWWYLFLFTIVWIPVVIEIFTIKIFISFFRV
jgi:hypothetical protein